MSEGVWARGLGRKGEREVIPERPWMEGNILKCHNDFRRNRANLLLV